MKNNDVQKEIDRMTKHRTTNNNINDLMYRAGLTAQGCWDQMDDYDRQAIEIFAELIIKECASIVDNHGRWILYDKLAVKIKEHFGVEEC